MEKQYGHSGSNMAMVFIGSYVVGVEQIEKELKKTVKKYAGQGRVDWPDAIEITRDKTTEPETEIVTKSPIYLAFFTRQAVRNATRYFYLLNYLEQEYPSLVIKV